MKTIIACVFLLLFSVGCGWIQSLKKEKKERPDTKEDARIVDVLSKFQLYNSKIESHRDIDGFILTDACDSLLFSSLLVAVGKNVNLRAAIKDGVAFRRPLTYVPCYPGFSRSSMSRDMLIGLLWGIWATKDKALLSEFMNKTLDNHGKLGEGAAETLLVTPALWATMGDMDERLNGKKHPILQSYPQSWSVPVRGFEAHLRMLHIQLRYEVTGKVGNSERAALAAIASAEPNNALAQALIAQHSTGDFGPAIDALLNNQWWPSDRLPTSNDRREPWLTQRSYLEEDGSISSNWLPSTPDKPFTEHTGGDFLFAAWIVLSHFNKL